MIYSLIADASYPVNDISCTKDAFKGCRILGKYCVKCA